MTWTNQKPVVLLGNVFCATNLAIGTLHVTTSAQEALEGVVDLGEHEEEEDLELSFNSELCFNFKLCCIIWNYVLNFRTILCTYVDNYVQQWRRILCLIR